MTKSYKKVKRKRHSVVPCLFWNLKYNRIRVSSIHGKNDNNIFVRYLIKNNRWYFDNINNSGTTFGSITKDYLFGMPITIPEDKLVAMFEHKSSLIEQQIYANEQQIRELQSLRNWLLPVLMNGQATIIDWYAK